MEYTQVSPETKETKTRTQKQQQKQNKKKITAPPAQYSGDPEKVPSTQTMLSE